MSDTYSFVLHYLSLTLTENLEDTIPCIHYGPICKQQPPKIFKIFNTLSPSSIFPTHDHRHSQ